MQLIRSSSSVLKVGFAKMVLGHEPVMLALELLIPSESNSLLHQEIKIVGVASLAVSITVHDFPSWRSPLLLPCTPNTQIFEDDMPSSPPISSHSNNVHLYKS